MEFLKTLALILRKLKLLKSRNWKTIKLNVENLKPSFKNLKSRGLNLDSKLEILSILTKEIDIKT